MSNDAKQTDMISIDNKNTILYIVAYIVHYERDVYFPVFINIFFKETVTNKCNSVIIERQHLAIYNSYFVADLC